MRSLPSQADAASKPKRVRIVLPDGYEVFSPPQPSSVSALDRLWTVAEAAAYLSVHKNSLYLAAAKGELRCRRIGRLVRFAREDLDQWTRGEG